MRDVLAVIMFFFCDWLEINRLVCENNVTIISNSIVYLLCFVRDCIPYMSTHQSRRIFTACFLSSFFRVELLPLIGSYTCANCIQKKLTSQSWNSIPDMPVVNDIRQILVTVCQDVHNWCPMMINSAISGRNKLN